MILPLFIFCTFAIADAQIETKWVNDLTTEALSDPTSWTAGVPTAADTVNFDIGSPFKVMMDVEASI